MKMPKTFSDRMVNRLNDICFEERKNEYECHQANCYHIGWCPYIWHKYHVEIGDVDEYDQARRGPHVSQRSG